MNIDISEFRENALRGAAIATRNPEIREDAAQTVLVRILKGKKVDPDGAANYAVVSGKRAAIDIVRKESKHVSLSDKRLFRKIKNIPNHKGDGKMALMAIMEESLKTLNPVELETVKVVLRFDWDMSRIGDHLGVADNTAAQRFCRAMRKMRSFCHQKRKED